MPSDDQLRRFGQWFWDSEFWLPPGVTWEDLRPDGSKDVTYADFNHLGYPVLIGLVIVSVRYLVENVVFRPFGRWLDIRDHRTNPSKLSGSPQLEMEFRQSASWSHATIARMGQKAGATEREVEVWLRHRNRLSHPSKLDKFSETGWRWVFYSGILAYGLWVLWRKPWFWDIVDCWVQFPFHPMARDVWWYYMIELSFYWCLFFSQFMGDVKRKDFWSMFVHHVATIMLVSFSWTCHLHKAGTLIMITHDVSDVFLESAKLFHYAKKERCATVLFTAFTVVWVMTRMGVYPTWIVYSITVEAPQLIGYFPAYIFLNVLLSILLGLNIFWTYFILKVSYITLLSPAKRIEKDIRSQSSTTQSSEGDGEAIEDDEKTSDKKDR